MNSAINELMSPEEQAVRWLTRQQDGLSTREQREFTAWLAQADNAAHYASTQQLCQRVGELPQ